jgi:hypothetical protein
MPDDIKPTPGAGRGLTPEMPSEPPKEVKEMTFTYDPNFANKGVGDSVVSIDHKEVKTDSAEVKKDNEKPELVIKSPTDDKKVEEIKKEEPKKDEKKEEVKKDEPKSVLKAPTEVKKEDAKVEDKSKEQEKSGSIKPITPVKEHKDGQDAFDYTGFTPQEQINLKNMSRQSREYAANLIKENKGLAALREATYLQHDQGYTLSPEYQQLQSKGYFAQTEGQCWEQALLAIKAAKKFRDITGFDKNGKPVLSEEREPSDADEIRIAGNLSACTNAVQQIGGQLQTFPQRFKQQIQSDLQAVEAVRKERFAWVADPKLLEYSVNVEGSGDKKLKDIKSDFKSMLPIYWQSSPIAEVASDLFVAMIIQGAELREAKNGQTVAQIKNDELKRGEPSSDTQPIKKEQNGVLANGVPSVFSLDGMPSRR